jgi:hypothetical protein
VLPTTTPSAVPTRSPTELPTKVGIIDLSVTFTIEQSIGSVSYCDYLAAPLTWDLLFKLAVVASVDDLSSSPSLSLGARRELTSSSLSIGNVKNLVVTGRIINIQSIRMNLNNEK